LLARRRMLAAITTVIAGATILAGPAAAHAAEAGRGLVSQSIPTTAESDKNDKNDKNESSSGTLFDDLGLSLDDTINNTLDDTVDGTLDDTLDDGVDIPSHLGGLGLNSLFGKISEKGDGD
jgi:hypothetical protein